MKEYERPILNLIHIDTTDLISASSVGADFGWTVSEDPNDDN